ncbi:hypothetical protein KOW79_017148 [Hemibagrus wyckioides]|uniref:Uncharacterized protein n=1 Tax=Hemibagrus wyckioides TaxID=337641 RepID=A0A9D3NDA2_9TELE|nr:uncharacterized protein LOC131371191 [Hemibagrus wyckioides]KAG7320005.1 hypothetical protein KOW79_017148 [Hemibagrus wyckioides]
MPSARIMGAFIKILHVTLLLSSFGFTLQSSEFLQCFNDYDVELKCSFSAKPDTCAEYELGASRLNTDNLCTSRFVEIRPGECECRLHMKDGFVLYEILVINLMKGDKIWHTTNISTEGSLKPKRPIITSVTQNMNGDFFVTLNTTYTRKTFMDYLEVELEYAIDGSNDYVTQNVGKVRHSYEIVGRKLQPNSKYVVKARVKSNYPPNKTFSDYSEPYVFSTPQSLQNILRIIMPTLCIILIICISSVYFWFNRIIKPWWDKIPTPKFSTHFVKQVPQLLSFQTELSAVSLDSSANHIIKNTCVVQSEDSYKIYNPSLGKGIETSSLVYLLAENQSVNRNGSEGAGVEHQSTNTKQSCKSQKSDELFSGICNQDSGISNRTYLLSDSSSSSTFEQPAVNSGPSKNFPVSSENLDLMLQMDLDYYKLSGSTASGNSKLIPITPPSSEMAVDLLHHIAGDVGDHKALSSYNDLIIEKPFSTKKPQDALFSAHDGFVIPMEDGYQAF